MLRVPADRGPLRPIETPEDRRRRLREDVRAEVMTQERIRALQHQLRESRDAWRLSPDNLRLVLDEGLRLHGHRGLELVQSGPLAGQAWLLRNLPASWGECRPAIHDAKGHLPKLVFLTEVARGPAPARELPRRARPSRTGASRRWRSR